MGWGSSARRGCGRKVRAFPRMFVFLGFRTRRNLGCPGNFAGMSRTPGGVQKACAKKKVRAHFSFPKTGKTELSTTTSLDRILANLAKAMVDMIFLCFPGFGYLP